jgi:hypothetical protein
VYVINHHPSKGVLMLPVQQKFVTKNNTEWSAILVTSTHPCLDGDLLHTYPPLHIRINHKDFLVLISYLGYVSFLLEENLNMED